MIVRVYNAHTFAAYATEVSDFLKTSEITEIPALVQSLVKAFWSGPAGPPFTTGFPRPKTTPSKVPTLRTPPRSPCRREPRMRLG